MDSYKVLYRSTGLLSGVELGETVELDSVDGKHLEGLGIVEKVKAKAEAPEKPAASKPADTDKGGKDAKSGKPASSKPADK